MSISPDQTESFYTAFFTKDPYWSTPFPNPDEARRWAKVGEYLSDIAHPREMAGQPRLRILEVGCGRGWLTHQASAYGQCDGIDPVAGSIEQARKLYPALSFRAGMVGDLLRNPSFKPYDVVINSEVIEHVQDKDPFVEDLRKCLVMDGHLVLTTPLAEQFEHWKTRLGATGQPVEEWLTEREVRVLFQRHGFTVLAHDRVYLEMQKMSFLNRLCVSQKLMRLLETFRMSCVMSAMKYSASIYQVWLFRRTGAE
ncbi:MAG: class I SAM-dependent methyltransferase [Verrucomicrobia bacterium]|nr:class I SAM-dependent methyltransferase [Verrucomicrobiota bacterium]